MATCTRLAAWSRCTMLLLAGLLFKWFPGLQRQESRHVWQLKDSDSMEGASTALEIKRLSDP